MKRFFLNTLSIALGLLIAAAIIYGIYFLSPFTIASSRAEATQTLAYADFVTIMFTAASLILAALGFVVAILAIIGWNSIGNRVNTLAVEFLSDSLQDGGKLNDLVREEATNIIFRGIDPIDRDYDDYPEDDDNDRGGR